MKKKKPLSPTASSASDSSREELKLSKTKKNPPDSLSSSSSSSTPTEGERDSAYLSFHQAKKYSMLPSMDRPPKKQDSSALDTSRNSSRLGSRYQKKPPPARFQNNQPSLAIPSTTNITSDTESHETILTARRVRPFQLPEQNISQLNLVQQAVYATPAFRSGLHNRYTGSDSNTRGSATPNIKGVETDTLGTTYEMTDMAPPVFMGSLKKKFDEPQEDPILDDIENVPRLDTADSPKHIPKADLLNALDRDNPLAHIFKNASESQLGLSDMKKKIITQVQDPGEQERLLKECEELFQQQAEIDKEFFDEERPLPTILTWAQIVGCIVVLCLVLAGLAALFRYVEIGAVWLGTDLWRWLSLASLCVGSPLILFLFCRVISVTLQRWGPESFTWLFPNTERGLAAALWGILTFTSYSHILRTSRNPEGGFLFFLPGLFLSTLVLGFLRVFKVMIDNYLNIRFNTLNYWDNILEINNKRKILKAVLKAVDSMRKKPVKIKLIERHRVNFSEITNRLQSLVSRKEDLVLSKDEIKQQVKSIFSLDTEGRGWLTAADFHRANFTSAKMAQTAFDMFDTDQTGYVTLTKMFHTLYGIQKDQKNFAKTLESRKNLVGILISALDVVFGVVAIFVIAAVYELDFQNFYIPVSTSLLAFSFIFGNSIKSQWENFVFLFFVRPYEIGDRVAVNGGPGTLFVKSIQFTVTHFTRPDGRLLIIPNQVLASSSIESWKRTKFIGLEIAVDFAIQTEIELIYKFTEEIKHWEATDSSLPWDTEGFLFYTGGIEKLNSIRLFIWSELKGVKWQNTAMRLGGATKLTLAMAHYANELGLKFVCPPQVININQPFPNFTRTDESVIDVPKVPSDSDFR